MIGMIAAVSSNGIIGIDNKLPFNYPADMKYFRETTKGSTIIMGRRTFESIGKPLPKRRNIVITSQRIEWHGVENFHTIEVAMKKIDQDYKDFCSSCEQSMDMMILPPTVWFAGGARIYEEGMQYAEEIHLTVTPDMIDAKADVARFPFINPRKFEIKEWRQLTPGDDTLRLYIYKKI
jgi:dihydrofolate reductase